MIKYPDDKLLQRERVCLVFSSRWLSITAGKSRQLFRAPSCIAFKSRERRNACLHACMPACLPLRLCLFVGLTRSQDPATRTGPPPPHSRWVCPPHLGNFHTGLPTGQPNLDTPLFLGYVSLTVVNLTIANRAAEATDCSPVLFSKSSRFCLDTMFSEMLLC